MKIIRYLDSKGQTGFAAGNRKISGDIFGVFSVTHEPADIQKVLTPVAPVALMCIGLNYRQHAGMQGTVKRDGMIQQSGHVQQLICARFTPDDLLIGPKGRFENPIITERHWKQVRLWRPLCRGRQPDAEPDGSQPTAGSERWEQAGGGQSHTGTSFGWWCDRFATIARRVCDIVNQTRSSDCRPLK